MRRLALLRCVLTHFLPWHSLKSYFEEFLNKPTDGSLKLVKYILNCVNDQLWIETNFTDAFNWIFLGFNPRFINHIFSFFISFFVPRFILFAFFSLLVSSFFLHQLLLHFARGLQLNVVEEGGRRTNDRIETRIDNTSYKLPELFFSLVSRFAPFSVCCGSFLISSLSLYAESWISLNRFPSSFSSSSPFSSSSSNDLCENLMDPRASLLFTPIRASTLSGNE